MLRNVTGTLYMQSNSVNKVTFAAGDAAAATFQALRTAGAVEVCCNNYDGMVRSVTFPKPTTVAGALDLQINKVLAVVECPKLERVVGDLHLNTSPALARAELPALVAIGGGFYLHDISLLTTVTVSRVFESAGINFYAYNTRFTCTDANGLAAVAAACEKSSTCTNDSRNLASCQ